MKRLVCMILAPLLACAAPVAGAEQLLADKMEVLRALDIRVSDEDAARVRQRLIDAKARTVAGGYGEPTDDSWFSYESILTDMGAGGGSFDSQTWEIIPITDDVYARDVEMIDVYAGYLGLLHAVERMSGGAVAISDFNMDIDEAVWRRGSGPFYLLFRVNGKPCRYQARLQTDWMDLGFLDFLNERIAEEDPGRALWFLDGGNQCVIAFYRDADWAGRFTAATGLALADSSAALGFSIDFLSGILGLFF